MVMTGRCQRGGAVGALPSLISYSPLKIFTTNEKKGRREKSEKLVTICKKDEFFPDFIHFLTQGGGGFNPSSPLKKIRPLGHNRRQEWGGG